MDIRFIAGKTRSWTSTSERLLLESDVLHEPDILLWTGLPVHEADGVYRILVYPMKYAQGFVVLKLESCDYLPIIVTFALRQSSSTQTLMT